MEIPVSHPNFTELENKILDWWEKEGIVEKYLHKNDKSSKKFKFLDGPITANNPMGVHHAHGRTVKDFFQRYKNMQGYKQRFQNGFDCQGLWVEVEEEKNLGFNSKRDIENFGLDKFSHACRNRVDKYSEVQAKQSQRLGMFMDWGNSYYTMSETNNLHIWHFLKNIDEKGWLYKGVDAMPWCIRCGTAISQHELSDGGYKDVTHDSIYLRFNLTKPAIELITSDLNLSKDQTYSFLVWTTTPWTLLANVAIAVNPELNYVIATINEENLILTENRLKVLNDKPAIKANFTGQKLIDLLEQSGNHVYQGPFDESIPFQVNHKIIAWNEVSHEEGTGIVHIAPGAGKEDFDLRKKYNLDILTPIDEFGDYANGYGRSTGRNVNQVRPEIYSSLKEKKLFYKTEPIFHSYPHCWRCKEELVFRTTTEWFIKCDEIRPLMKDAVKSVNWIPEYSAKRMQDWLDNMGDWPISRKRYWGLALPFYESTDGLEYYVVGSKEELKQLAVDPEKVDQLPELHRPWIDEIKIKSPKTGQILTRVKDVGDCWLDAGIVPFSTVNYLNDKKYWQDWYPFDFITEYIAQVKLWFYSTLFMSVTLKNQVPWKNVLATGFLVDEKGETMHKSKGNTIAFDEAAEKAGADSIRWLYLRERAANFYGTGNLRFGYHVLDEVRRRFLVILWNSYRFFVQNAILDGWNPNQTDLTFHRKNPLDRWIISRLNQLIKTVTHNLENFDTPDACTEIELFVVNDFSQWYIRRSRNRAGPTVKEAGEKEGFYLTTYLVLTYLTKLLAPFTPFIAEMMYQNLRILKDPISIHLCDWPRVNARLINPDLEANMALIRAMVEKVHRQRKSQSIRVRQPLASAKITLNSKPNLKNELRKVLLEEINLHDIEFEVKKDTAEISVELDTEITEDLRAEGVLREFIRSVQELRKVADYQLCNRINLTINGASKSLQNILHENTREIQAQLLVSKLFFDQPGHGEISQSVEIDGETSTITLQKI